ncbi:MAG: pre-peptidase C-terminal domain-containing protein, partial [Chloroflexi bacterium]|nr:pre-peptidase C-terminal domain-containing protein [Chloroflexota bacterium]
GNPELLVRIADTCSTSGYWAVYAGTAAAADFSVAIRDTETNELKWFRSRGGQSVADAEAFACGATGNSGFDLGPDNSWPQGMTYALGRFYVVDYLDRKVYAYRGSDGRQDADAGFDLAPNNSWPEGVTYAQDRLYVVDYVDEKAYAYRTSDGRYDSLADFDLATGNTRPRGITYAQGRFYVVDYLDRKVYAYRGSDGHRDAAADFDLAPDNSSPEGIAYAQDRLYVVDSVDDRVYAYRVSDGGRDPLAGFDLAPDNSSPEGITYAGGKLFVIDSSDDKVYAYSLDGSGDGATDDHGDTFADATPVAVPSTTAGELEASGDYDYFRLVVDESTTLTVETTGSTDTYGTLFDGSGSSLASDDDYGAGLNFKIEREVEAGTYYVRVRGYAFSTGAYELRVSTSGGGSSSPDLVVQSPSVDDTSLTAGQSFTFRITVRNRGDGRSASTTLRYYRSSNSTISASDTQVGTDAVGALAASGSSAESISLTAPSSAGTYYYGACVDSVLRESSTGNNCSQGVRVTVSGDGGGLFSGSVTRCSGSETTSGTWNITIGGNVRANQSVSNVTATGYVEPVKRRVGSQFLGSFAPNQTKNFNITGTVSGVAPTRCEVEVRGTRDNANAKALRLSAPLERAEREP